MDNQADVLPRVRGCTRRVGILTTVGAGAVLVGWLLGASWMMSPILGSVAMKANAALALVLLGAALWISPDPGMPGPRVRVAGALSSAVVLLGLLTLIEYAAGIDLHIDQAIGHDGIVAAYGAPGRMAPGAALSLVLLGVALQVRGPRRRLNHLDQWLSPPVAAIGALALLGYVYGAPWLYNAGRFASMAPTTAALLLVLSLCVMMTAEDARAARLLASDGGAGRTSRRLLPLAILGPPVIGACALWGKRAGVFDVEIAVALLVVATMLVLGVAIWRHAVHLEWAERRQATALQELESRVQTEVAQRLAAEQRSFQLLEHLPVGVFVLNAVGVPVYANVMSRDLLGQGIVPGAGVEQLAEVYRVVRADTATAYPPDEMPLVRALKGQVSSADDLEILRGEERVLLDVRGTPVFDAEGSIKYAVASFTDITERAQTRKLLDERSRELQLRAAHLERANNDLEHFSYVASHDLQEPLRMVASYVQLLKKRYRGRLDAEADEMIDFAEEGAIRIKELILDLQAYARIGRSPELASPVFMQDCVDAAMSHLASSIRASNAHISCEPLPRVRVSASLFTQVFESLIDNSLKFHGAVRPEIKICAEREGDSWRFSVRDNGIGIHSQYAERVFMIFQRLNGRKDFSGTGMGLAICKKIVERYDGRIWVNSELGQGSNFQFALPDSTCELVT